MNQEQLTLVDPLFLPFDHQENPYPELYEYFLLAKIYEKLDEIEASHIGLFSLRFGKKSLLTGLDVTQHIQNNPGFDVYLFNPFPQEDHLYYNIWNQGEFNHPNIVKITQEILNTTHPEIILGNLGRPCNKTLFCNYWVGTKAFWKCYMRFLIPIAEKMISIPNTYLSDTAYHRGATPFFPFIIERMLSTFLMTYDEYKSLSYKYSDDMLEKLIIHEYEREMCNKIRPYTEACDKKYGNVWPEQVQQELAALRIQTIKVFEQHNFDQQFRY